MQHMNRSDLASQHHPPSFPANDQSRERVGERSQDKEDLSYVDEGFKRLVSLENYVEQKRRQKLSNCKNEEEATDCTQSRPSHLTQTRDSSMQRLLSNCAQNPNAMRNSMKALPPLSNSKPPANFYSTVKVQQAGALALTKCPALIPNKLNALSKSGAQAKENPDFLSSDEFEKNCDTMS